MFPALSTGDLSVQRQLESLLALPHAGDSNFQVIDISKEAELLLKRREVPEAAVGPNIVNHHLIIRILFFNFLKC